MTRRRTRRQQQRATRTPTQPYPQPYLVVAVLVADGEVAGRLVHVAHPPREDAVPWRAVPAGRVSGGGVRRWRRWRTFELLVHGLADELQVGDLEHELVRLLLLRRDLLGWHTAHNPVIARPRRCPRSRGNSSTGGVKQGQWRLRRCASLLSGRSRAHPQRRVSTEREREMAHRPE